MGNLSEQDLENIRTGIESAIRVFRNTIQDEPDGWAERKARKQTERVIRSAGNQFTTDAEEGRVPCDPEFWNAYMLAYTAGYHQGQLDFADMEGFGEDLREGSGR